VQTTPITLKEHESSECLIPRAVAVALATSKQIEIRVAPGATEDSWELKPGSKVGVVTVGEYQFLILPKIGIRNVLALMNLPTHKERWADDLFFYGDDQGIFVAMVRAFLQTLERTFLQGLKHDYIEREERLFAPRGRIDTRALARRPAIPIPVPCRFDDYSADTPMNQFLLSAIRRSTLVPGVPSRERRHLHHMESLFEGIREDDDFLRFVRAWSPNRLERHYLPSIRLATLILENLSIRTASGAAIGTTFLLDMNEVVELFVSEELRQRLEPSLSVKLQYPSHLDTNNEVRIKPDIVVIGSGGPLVIADVKYKLIEELDEVRNADLYQVAAYASALGVSHAVLITCRGEGSPTSEIVSIRTRNTNVAISIWPVDLTNTIDVIHRQLDEMADRVVRLATMVGCP
jgi:5-methylcytosine-specific restriction enzyme subunit McrC